MMLLKQSVAVDIKLGPFVDSTGAAVTGLTIAQADVRVAKNANNWAQKSQASTAVHEENGWYEVNLDTTDTGTLGCLIVNVNKTGALPVWREFLVVPANVYESLVNGVEWLEVTATRPVFSNSGGTHTVKKQDGTTTQFTRTLTGDGSAQPIVAAS